MNTLFITHHYLSSSGGGSFASRSYINAFADLSDSMTLLYPVKEGQNVFPGINGKIHLVPVKYEKSKFGKLLDVFFGQVHRYMSVAPEILRDGKFDVVVFDTSLVSFKLIDLAKSSGAKVIVIHHNFQYEYFRDNTSALLKLPVLYWCRKYEGEAVRKADMNLILTNQDISLLSDTYASGNDSNFYRLGTFEYSRTRENPDMNSNISVINKFVISGNLSAAQTKNSLMPWLKDYFPVLKSVFPDSTLTVAGRNPDSELRTLCQSAGASLIPSPEDMDAIIRTADCYICPTCLGGGLKLRIMDGLKWGLPVLTHSVSARGYDDLVKQGFVVSYDNIDSFRSALQELGKHEFDRRAIYQAYRASFSYESGLARLSHLLEILNGTIKG